MGGAVYAAVHVASTHAPLRGEPLSSNSATSSHALKLTLRHGANNFSHLRRQHLYTV